VRQKMLKKKERKGQYKNKKNYVKDVLHTYISDCGVVRESRSIMRPGIWYRTNIQNMLIWESFSLSL